MSLHEKRVLEVTNFVTFPNPNNKNWFITVSLGDLEGVG